MSIDIVLTTYEEDVDLQEVNETVTRSPHQDADPIDEPILVSVNWYLMADLSFYGD